jgi:predicted ATP-grasp superfamily ATP-dependent carboligase
MPALALVALSARILADAAARDGHEAVAIDLFGDLDTRRACTSWRPAGRPGTLQIDGPQVLAVLRELARGGRVAGWVAGGGCEGEPELLVQGAAVLPLIGSAPQAMRRARDPLVFFGFLAAHGIAHPEVRSTAPGDGEGWLFKDAHGSGGWHIRHAWSPHAVAAGGQPYYQRVAPGRPMSATFCANGTGAVVLGYNDLTICALPGRPFVYGGAVGPVPLAEAVARQVTRAVRLLTAELALQGLCSLDFMLDGDEVLVLEVNPRPPASMALYDGHLAGGLMSAHLDACLQGRLPAPTAAPAEGAAVRGHEIVFAPRPLRLHAAAARALHAWPDCHDLPAAGASFDKGDPLCSLGARGDSAEQVGSSLKSGRDALLETLESLR